MARLTSAANVLRSCCELLRSTEIRHFASQHASQQNHAFLRCEAAANVLRSCCETPYPFRVTALRAAWGGGSAPRKWRNDVLIKISGPTFGFGAAPEIGIEVERNGQRYRCIAKRPHVGRNGPTVILTWQSNCADCAAPFTVTTGLSGIKAMNTRCPQHKSPGRPASEQAAKAISDNRRKWRRRP